MKILKDGGALLNQPRANPGSQRAQMRDQMTAILNGNVSRADLSRFLCKNHPDHVTSEMVHGALDAVKKCRPRKHEFLTNVWHVNYCGTGGTRYKLFNLSTGAVLVAAGCKGMKIVKYGSPGYTRKVGSMNVAEGMHLNIETNPEKIDFLLREKGIPLIFLSAGALFKGSKLIRKVRMRLGCPTLFNLIGPLTNPLEPAAQVIGVPNVQQADTLTEYLEKEGFGRTIVVYGQHGEDALTTTGKSHIVEINSRKKVTKFSIVPEDFDIPRANVKDIASGTLQDNVAYLKNILGGKKGPRRDIVALNAGMLIYASETKIMDLDRCYRLALESIDSKRALNVFDSIRDRK